MSGASVGAACFGVERRATASGRVRYGGEGHGGRRRGVGGDKTGNVAGASVNSRV